MIPVLLRSILFPSKIKSRNTWTMYFVWIFQEPQEKSNIPNHTPVIYKCGKYHRPSHDSRISMSRTRALHFKGIPLCFQFKYQVSQPASQWTQLRNLRWSEKPLLLLIWVNDSLKDNQFGSRAYQEALPAHQALLCSGSCGSSRSWAEAASPPVLTLFRDSSSERSASLCPSDPLPGLWGLLCTHEALHSWLETKWTATGCGTPCKEVTLPITQCHIRQGSRHRLVVSINADPWKERILCRTGGEAWEGSAL